MKKIDYKNLLSKNIKQLRLNKNLTQEELSLALSLDNSYISKLEKGKINITLDKLESIANYFDVNITDLLS